MITFEALDVILRVQNLPGFMARMRAGAKSVSSIGKAAVDSNKKTTAAIYATARKATLGLTAMAAIATAAGYKQSVEFEKQLTLVHTQAGATIAEMKAFKEPLLEMAKTLPQGPIELAKGLYHIKSIGIPAAQAMEALRVAAEGAMVGNADLEQTTSALGAAWLAGIKGANGFKNTMAIMNATVGAGNMRMDELVTALGTGVLPTAKLAGLGIQDVMAALALLKDEGYGAYGAMAQFATALHFFTSPTKKASDAFKKLGLSQLDLADMMRKRGMVPTLALLRDRLKLTGEEMARLSDKKWAPETQQEKLLGAILPGGRGRVFRVLLNQVDRYQMKINQINKTTKNFDSAIKATKDTSAVRLHIAWSKVQVDLVKLGDTVKGPMTDALVFGINILDTFLTGLASLGKVKDAWDALPGPIKFVILWVSVFIGQLYMIRAVTTFLWLMGAAWEYLTVTIMAVRGAMYLLFVAGGPIGWILLAISLLLTLMIVKWGWFKQAGINAFHWIVRAAMDVWNWLKVHWSSPLVQILIGPWGQAIQWIVVHWKQIKSAMSLLWGWISTHWVALGPILFGPFFLAIRLVVDRFRQFIAFIKRAYNNIKGPMSAIGNWVGGAAGKVWKVVTQPKGGLDPSRKPINGPGGYTGGYVYGSGIMDVGEHGRERIFLPEGSRIQPAGFRSMPGGGGGGGGGGDVMEIHVHSYLDGKEVSENVSRHMANKKARK